jgi:hypothetical protein
MAKCIRFSALFLILMLASACGEKSGPTSTAPMADTPENRKIAADSYLKAMPPEEMLQNMTANMIQRMPAETKEQLLKAIKDKDLVANIRRVTETALIKHFTPDEMNAMSNFFGSPAGKSARSKYSAYMGDVMPQVNGEMRKVFAKLQEQSPKPGEKEGAPKAAEPAKPEHPKAAAPKPEAAKPAQPATPQAIPAKPEVKQPQAEKPQPEKPKK